MRIAGARSLCLERAAVGISDPTREPESTSRDDRDRQHLLEVVAEVVRRLGVRLHGFTWMEQHVPLVLDRANANLSRALQRLTASSGASCSRRHNRSDHPLQGSPRSAAVSHVGRGEPVLAMVSG